MAGSPTVPRVGYENAAKDIWGYHAGLDLGKRQDHTALAIVARMKTKSGRTPRGRALYRRDAEDPVFRLVHMERFELGTEYRTIAMHVEAVLADPLLALTHKTHDPETLQPVQRTYHPTLAVDATGPGDGVAEMIRPDRFKGAFRRVNITGGYSLAFEGGSYLIPQRLLVGDLDASIEFGYLRAAKGIPHAAQVVKEMRTFKREYTRKRGDVTYDTWRQTDHDDMIFAMALAFWGANMGSGNRAVSGQVTLPRSSAPWE